MNARLRTVLFWCHLAIGVSAGLIVGLMSVTGALLGFERQVIAMVDGAPAVPAHDGAARLPLDSLLALRGVARADISSIALRADVHEPVTVRFRDRARPAIALDPFTADTLTIPKGGKAQAFFSAVTRWHRFLGATTAPARGTARIFTGLANFLFLMLVLSGFVLWWPRRWTAAIVRSSLRFDGRLRGKARDFNWHTVAGFWIAMPLFAIVTAGVFMAYQWPGKWLDRALGTPAEQLAAAQPERPAAEPKPAAPKQAGPPPNPVRADDATLDATFGAMERTIPAWRSATISLPGLKDSTLQVSVGEGNMLRADLRTTLTLQRATLLPTAVRSYASLSASRKIRAWMRYTHTGEAFGVTGQVIATLASALAGLLVWTGLALALRRLGAWRRRRGRAVGVAAA